MISDHATHFTIGSSMMKRRESMSHPRKIIISLRPPLESIFRIEAGSSRLIGSNTPAKGLKMMNTDITTACPALGTILQLIGEYSTTVDPSPMYPSAPPLHCGSILTYDSSAAPNVTSLSSIRGLGSCCAYGEGKASGSHSFQ